jgi:hypothetical protein
MDTFKFECNGQY